MADLKSNMPVGMGWIQGERSELLYVLTSYWMPTLRASSDDYSFRRTGVILSAYFKSMLPTSKSMLPTLRVCCLLYKYVAYFASMLPTLRV